MRWAEKMTDKKVKLLTARLTAGGEHEGSEAAEALEYKRCINAVDELGRIGHSQAVPVLVQAGKNKKMRFVARSHASSTLGDIRNPQAILALIKALDDKAHSSSVQEDIIIMLTAIKDPQAVPALVRALGDKSTLVRIKAAEALGAWESREAVPALIAALKDQNSAVTKHVFEENGNSTPLLTQWVCNEAAIALGKIGDARAVPALNAAWRNERCYIHTRGYAIEALGAIGGPLAVHPLIEALDNAECGEGAVKALAMIGAAAFPALTEALSREKKRPLIIPALIEIVQADEYLLPRCRAAEALKAIAAHQPDPALRAALPALRWNHRRNNWHHQNPVFQEALEQIESVTAASRSLPLPAVAPPPDARTLPRPAAGVSSEASATLVPRGFWTRLCRTVKGI